MRFPLIALIGLFVLLLASGPANAEDDGPEARLIETKAASVVNVQFVLEITANRGGRVQELERRVRATGVVVDASGLVMLPAQAFEATVARPRFGRGRRGGRGGSQEPIETTANPTNIRVSFPGDEKEYAAILGAKDSKSGLAFVLIDELGAAKPTALDTTKTATPRIGQVLFGVSRMNQTYDHAPVCTRSRVTGKITKPRLMWAIEDASRHVGKPLFTADGAVAGVCSIQSSEGRGQGRMFLLPIESVQKVIVRAKASAAKALQEVREAREDEEEAAEAEKEPEAPKTPAAEPDEKDGDDGK